MSKIIRLTKENEKMIAELKTLYEELFDNKMKFTDNQIINTALNTEKNVAKKLKYL